MPFSASLPGGERRPEAPSEAPPTASAELEDSLAPTVVQAPSEAAAPEASVPEASAVVSEATSIVPEASADVAVAAPEIGRNVEAVAP